MLSQNGKNEVRGKNFTNDEVLLLAELVARHKSILENKQTGIVSHKQKETTWQTLSEEFNAISSGGPRSCKMLMEKWRNIKKNSTKNYSAKKKSIKTTGGGTDNTILLVETPVDAIVHDVIGARMTGLDAECDSDAVAVPDENLPGAAVNLRDCNVPDIHTKTPNGSQALPSTSYTSTVLLMNSTGETSSADCPDYTPALFRTPTKPTNIVLSTRSGPSGHLDARQPLSNPSNKSSVLPEQQSPTDWGDYTPAHLKAPTTNVLSTRSGPSRTTTSKTNEKWCKLAEQKSEFLENLQKLRKTELEESIRKHREEIDLIHLRKRLLLEEHELKIKQMTEEHSLKMKMMSERK